MIPNNLQSTLQRNRPETPFDVKFRKQRTIIQVLISAMIVLYGAVFGAAHGAPDGQPHLFETLSFNLDTIRKLLTRAIFSHHSLVETSPFSQLLTVFTARN